MQQQTAEGVTAIHLCLHQLIHQLADVLSAGVALRLLACRRRAEEAVPEELHPVGCHGHGGGIHLPLPAWEGLRNGHGENRSGITASPHPCLAAAFTCSLNAVLR